MQLQTVATLFAVLAGLASASNQGSAPSGGNNSGSGGFSGGYEGDSDLSDEDIKAVLAAHNKYRSGCGLGPVNYSKRVASVAQQWARSNPGGCSAMNHNADRQGLGENIACQTGGGDKIQAMTDMISRWGDEYKNCGNTAGCKFVGGSSTSGATGHFTQMVDATCQEVGCGYNNGFLVCNYHPAGNMQGQEKQNICPNGFSGYGSGDGGVINDGGSGGSSPAPGASYSPAAPATGNSYAPAPSTNTDSGNRGRRGGHGRGHQGAHRNRNKGGNKGGRTRYITKGVSKPDNFDMGSYIPVHDNSDSGNTTPIVSYGGNSNESGNNAPTPSNGGSNSYSGSGSDGQSSYGSGNNSGGQADKDCDESKKAKKL